MYNIYKLKGNAKRKEKKREKEIKNKKKKKGTHLMESFQ